MNKNFDNINCISYWCTQSKAYLGPKGVPTVFKMVKKYVGNTWPPAMFSY